MSNCPISKKSQFSLEFFTVLILFLAFSLYFVFRMLDFYPQYLKSVEEETLRSDAYRLSEMLINDDGEPLNWDAAGGERRIGLSDEMQNKSNLLSVPKVSQFGALCAADYQNVKSLVGSSHDFYITVADVIGSINVNCGPAQLGENAVAVSRIVAFNNGEYGKVIVRVW